MLIRTQEQPGFSPSKSSSPGFSSSQRSLLGDRFYKISFDVGGANQTESVCHVNPDKQKLSPFTLHVAEIQTAYHGPCAQSLPTVVALPPHCPFLSLLFLSFSSWNMLTRWPQILSHVLIPPPSKVCFFMAVVPLLLTCSITSFYLFQELFTYFCVIFLPL